MQKGLIIKKVTNTYYIKSENNIYTCVARGKFKLEEITPTVGDMVLFNVTDEEKKEAVIENILDRENFIRRPKCANISMILLIISSKLPKPDLLMLDKQLAFSEFMNIKPVIVVNKIDLDLNIAMKIKDEYSKIGYDVILTNALTGEGVKDIVEKFENKDKSNSQKPFIVALSGNSGVGKSSLINSFFNKDVSMSGEISNRNKRGKNTTTITNLYEIDTDVYLVDTPRIFDF